MIFSGFTYLTEEQKASVSSTALDKIVYVLEQFFVENKFIGLFSVLFGISFWLFLDRARARGAPATRLFYRRIGWLFVFGALHGWLLWCFDVLRFYALWALLLPLFVRMPVRRLGAIAVSTAVLVPAAISGVRGLLPRPTDAGPAFDPTDPSNTAPTQPTPAALQAAQAAVRGAPQTVANLAAQIIKKLEAKTTRFDVQLDPAGLGKVDVRVEIGAEGRITAALSCHNPQGQAELKARSAELQQALEQAGFDISNGGLSFEMAGGQGGGAGAGQGQNETGQAFRGRAFQTALETAGDALQAAADGALSLNRSRLSGVDIRI